MGQADLRDMPDKKLYRKCVFYGENIRKWTRKFSALLPEVERRKLYKRHGCHSVFEFAAKVAGMKRETVKGVLRVAGKLEDKPLLYEQLETQGWGKLRVIASFATKENEKMLANKVQEMSKSTLITFVQEIKKQNGQAVKNGTGSGHIPENNSARIYVRLLLDPAVELRFRKLHKKLSRKAGGPMDFNEVMKELLDAYDRGAGVQTGKKAEHGELEEKAREKAKRVTGSRHIPAVVKKFLEEKHGGRCAFPGCSKVPEILHHTKRFALDPSHNPDFLAPLCEGHERLAHLGLVQNEEGPAENWTVVFGRQCSENEAKSEIDRIVNAYRQPVTHVLQ